MSGPVTPSPTGSQGCHPTESQPQEREPQNHTVFNTENEVVPTLQTPSKEELETNEKNLTHQGTGEAPGYLGQLVFKLR